MKAGDFCQEFINQGLRDGVIVAVIGDRYLYEYGMPNGTTALRNELGQAVSYATLSKKWIQAIARQYGVVNLICNPQKGNVRAIAQRIVDLSKGIDLE